MLCVDVYGHEAELPHEIVVIGGSETGVETAMDLAEKGHKVTVLCRQKSLASDAPHAHYISMLEDAYRHQQGFSYETGVKSYVEITETGVGFVIQTVQQQYTSASHVGLIFTLEPVFSAIVAYFFAHEVLQLRGYIGAALMMVSLLVMELDWKSLLRRRE